MLNCGLFPVTDTFRLYSRTLVICARTTYAMGTPKNRGLEIEPGRNL